MIVVVSKKNLEGAYGGKKEMNAARIILRVNILRLKGIFPSF